MFGLSVTFAGSSAAAAELPAAAREVPEPPGRQKAVRKKKENNIFEEDDFWEGGRWKKTPLSSKQHVSPTSRTNFSHDHRKSCSSAARIAADGTIIKCLEQRRTNLITEPTTATASADENGELLPARGSAVCHVASAGAREATARPGAASRRG